MCRWRRSAVVRIPAFRAGDRDGRNAATRGRNGIRNAVSGATRRRPRRRAGRRRQTWHRRWCPITEVVQIVAGLSQAARDGARQRASILDFAAGRQISLRQERPLHTAVKPSADEVPLGWGVPEGRRVLMGCHEPLAGSGGAVRWIGGVWFGVNRGMPAGMSRCSMLCHGWAGGVRGCRGVVTSGAKRGGTGGDALRRSMHVGGRRDVGGAGGTGLR